MLYRYIWIKADPETESGKCVWKRLKENSFTPTFIPTEYTGSLLVVKSTCNQFTWDRQWVFGSIPKDYTVESGSIQAREEWVPPQTSSKVVISLSECHSLIHCRKASQSPSDTRSYPLHTVFIGLWRTLSEAKEHGWLNSIRFPIFLKIRYGKGILMLCGKRQLTLERLAQASRENE